MPNFFFFKVAELRRLRRSKNCELRRVDDGADEARVALRRVRGELPRRVEAGGELVGPPEHLLPKPGNILQLVQLFWQARSRLHRNQMLQVKMRSTAFFNLYKICTFLHRSKLNILATHRLNKSAIFVLFQQHFAKFAMICNILPKFKNSAK